MKIDILQRHVVQEGESLFKISEQYYGVGYFWRVLYRYNKFVVGYDPDVIYPGMVLDIPKLDEGEILSETYHFLKREYDKQQKSKEV